MTSQQEQQGIVLLLHRQEPGRLRLTDEGARSVTMFLVESARGDAVDEIAEQILLAIDTECRFHDDGTIMGIVFRLPAEMSRRGHEEWLILDGRELMRTPH